MNKNMINSKKIPKIIVRIKGGLGNQLFCYAAARRLAVVNNAELVIDDVTGFSRDFQYKRQYALNNFKIQSRKATPAERLEPFERYRHKIIQWRARQQEFDQKSYIEQEGIDFDNRLLTFEVKKTVYLDGYWQSENYFKDIQDIIREDLQIITPQSLETNHIALQISNCSAVALHVRWFENDSKTAICNLATDYYKKAVALIEEKIDLPHYFLFSDNPEAASKKITLPQDRVTFVNHNQGDKNAYADLWLMSRCQHFITANSTFSWWGAWLGNCQHKIVISPKIELDGVGAWGFDGLIPSEWIEL
jgi:hypothetical protein